MCPFTLTTVNIYVSGSKGCLTNIHSCAVDWLLLKGIHKLYGMLVAHLRFSGLLHLPLPGQLADHYHNKLAFPVLYHCYPGEARRYGFGG